MKNIYNGLVLDAEGDGSISYTYATDPNLDLLRENDPLVRAMFTEFSALPGFALVMAGKALDQFSRYTGYGIEFGSTPADITLQGVKTFNSYGITGYTVTSPSYALNRGWVGLRDETGGDHIEGSGSLYKAADGHVDRTGFNLVMHELGHALGLSHPNDINVKPIYSMMGYGFQGGTSPIYDPSTYDDRAYYAATYSVLDILGFQALYGMAGKVERDDTYEITQDSETQTIFDTGGYDVLDARTATMGLKLTLKPGSIGGFDRLSVGIPFSRDEVLAERAELALVSPVRGTVRDADTTIEAIFGSNRQDRLEGNSVQNVLAGMGGNDTLLGTGNDFLVGGAGLDTLEGQGGDFADYGNFANHPVLTGRAAQVTQDGNVAIVRGIKVDMTRPTFQVYDDGTGDPAAPNSIGMDDLIGIGGIIGTSFADAIKLGGAGAAMKVYGGGGDDVITARHAADQIDGGDGMDTVVWSYASASDFVTFDMTTGERGGLGALAFMTYIEHMTGGPGDDTLGGDVSDNILIGGNGNDRLIGYGGSNILVGGAGRDTFVGGEGTDVFVDTADGAVLDYSGSTAAVTLARGANHSVSWGTEGASGPTLRGIGGHAQGDILVYGSSSAPLTIVGSDHGDKLVTFVNSPTTFLGGGGDDQIYGGQGADTIHGGAGRDVIDPGGFGGDTVDFGTGGGILRYSNLYGRHLTFDMASGVVEFRNTKTGPVVARDTILGDYDTFDAAGTVYGTFKAETFLNATDLHAGGGDDVITTAYGTWHVFGDDGNDRMTAGGNVWLLGGEGDDILDASGWNATLTGGPGADRLIGGQVSYWGASAGIGLVGNLGTAGDAEGDVLSGVGTVIGTAYADNISARSGWIYGGAGDDVIDAPGARIYGGDGNDVITGNIEWVYGEAGDDTFHARIAVGGTGNDTFFGTYAIDTFYGDAGDDVYRPGKGADVMFMNGGADTLVYAIGDGHDSLYDFTAGLDRIGIVRQAGYLDPTVTLTQTGAQSFKVYVDWYGEQAPGGGNPPPHVNGTIQVVGSPTLAASDFFLI